MYLRNTIATGCKLSPILHVSHCAPRASHPVMVDMYCLFGLWLSLGCRLVANCFKQSTASVGLRAHTLDEEFDYSNECSNCVWHVYFPHTSVQWSNRPVALRAKLAFAPRYFFMIRLLFPCFLLHLPVGRGTRANIERKNVPLPHLSDNSLLSPFFVVHS